MLTSGLLAMLWWNAADAQVRDPNTPVDPYPEPEPTGDEVQPEPEPTDDEIQPEPAPEPEPAPAPEEPKPPPAPIVFPHLFTAPTGRLLPAAMIYSSTGVDTGGGIKSDFRVGLGNVAEFGLATTDTIRKIVDDGDPERIQPYVLATFKMGVREDLLFEHQPAMSIGFRKSFEHNTSGRDTRVASLYFAASRDIGRKFAVHAGGVFWDASIKTDTEEVLLHDKGVNKQLRAFGGFEVEPLDDALIIVDLFWVPELRFRDISLPDNITLTPTLSWGVRYKVTESALLESGVRVPDIQDVNLLDAQIFGQFTFVSRKLSNWLRDIR
jgi:hypothetical protein